MKSGGYNIMRDDIALLEEHEKSPPSFSVHLYPGHWTLNNGPKFLYNNQISTILEDIRACKIPTDFIQIFDDAGVTYYKGCLIVELVDYRPPKAKDPLLENPDVQRVVLHPNGETLWADICALNAKAGSTWTDLDALELESKILMTISPPLCLNPNPQLARLVNSVLRVSTPNVPKSLKRKATAMVDLEEDETEKARRTKILQFMNPQLTSRKPNYKTLDFIEQRRAAIKQNPIPPTNHPENIPVGLQRNLMATYSNGGSAPQITPNHTSHYSQPNSTNGATIHQPNPSTVPVQQIPQHIQAVSAPAQRASPAKLQQQQSNESAPPQPSIQHSSQPTTQPVIPQLPIHQPPIQPSTQPVAAVQAPNPLVPQTAQPQPLQPQQNASFTPSLPPANFLNQPPPSKRRMSGAPKPSTPAASTPSPAPQQIIGQAQRQPTPQTVVHPQSQAALPSQTQPTQPHVQIQVQVPPQGQIQHQMHLSQVQAQVMQNFYQQQQAHAMALHHPMNVAPRQAQQIQQQIQSGRSTPATASNTGSSPAPNPTALARSPMPTSAAAVAISGRNTPVASAGTPQVVPRASPMGVNQPMVQRPPTAQAQNVAQQQQHQTGNQATQGHAQPQGQLHWHPSFQLIQPVNQQQLSLMYQTFIARHQGHPELAAQSRLYHAYLLNTNSRLIAQAQAQARLNQSAAQQQSGPAQGQLAHVVQGQQQLGTTLVQQTYANFNQQPAYNYFQQQQQNALAQRARYQYALQQQQIANGQHIAVPQQPMTSTQIQGAAQNVQNLQSR